MLTAPQMELLKLYAGKSIERTERVARDQELPIGTTIPGMESVTPIAESSDFHAIFTQLLEADQTM